MPSILLVDDEKDFHRPFSKPFKTENKPDYHLYLTETASQGLRQARKFLDKHEKNLVLIIDLILPDFPGDNLLEILDREYHQSGELKAILISAHKTPGQFQLLKKKYSWIYGCYAKPVDTDFLKNKIDRLCGKPLPVIGFDYQQFDEATADFIQQTTREIRVWMRRTVLEAIEIGEKIIQVKEMLDHGQFMDWVKFELGGNHATVGGLMRTARVFGSDKERIVNSGLSLSVVNLLAQNNTPPEMREKLISQSEGGERVHFKKARALHKKYQQKGQQSSPSTLSTSIEPPTKQPEEAKTETRQILPSENKSTPKQQIIGIVPKETETKESPQPTNRIWQFKNQQHLLFQGHPQSEEFIDGLPNQVALTLAFPPSPDWNRETFTSVQAKTTNIFQSEIDDLDPNTLHSIIRQIIEASTEDGDSVVVSFLPDFELNILQLVDSLGCRCFIAEPNPEKCQRVLSRFNG